MAGQTTGLQKTYILEDPSVEQYTAVTYGSNVGGCVAPSADNAIPLGVITNDERVSNAHSAGGSQLGRNVAVQLSGIAKVRLSGNVSYGERVILANGGAVKRLPQNPGVAEVTSITVTEGASAAGTITLTLNGKDIEVAVEATDTTAASVADAIKTEINKGDAYIAEATDEVVTITAVNKGYQIPPEFDGGDTGVTATVEVTTLGKEEGNGSFNILGIAEASGTDGKVIPVNIRIGHYYVP